MNRGNADNSIHKINIENHFQNRINVIVLAMKFSCTQLIEYNFIVRMIKDLVIKFIYQAGNAPKAKP